MAQQKAGPPATIKFIATRECTNGVLQNERAKATSSRIQESRRNELSRRQVAAKRRGVQPAIVRYERETPGELLHIDAKKLGTIAVGVTWHRITGNRAERSPRQKAGWECLHVAVDNASRVAYAEQLPDETAASAVLILDHAGASLATLGVPVVAMMTDNAFCYEQRTYATALARLGHRHLRTRPCTPRTNGKAERFMQTALREWATPNPTAILGRALARSPPSTPTGPHGARSTAPNELPASVNSHSSITS